MSRSKREWLILGAALAAVYGIWGSTYLAIAVAVRDIPPLAMMGLRSLSAGAVLYLLSRAAGAPKPDAAAWRNALLVGVLFFVIGHGLLSWSETRVASGPAAVLIAVEPIMIALLGWKGRLLTRRPASPRPASSMWLAMALGITGVALMASPGEGALDPLGIVALLLAAFSWSVGTFHVAPCGSPVRAAAMQLLCGGAILLLLATLTGESATLLQQPPRLDALLALGYLIVFGSVITFSAYLWLLRRIGAAKLASHTYVNPLIAVVLGMVWGGESLSRQTLFAALLVLAAVVLLVRGRRESAAEPQRALRPVLEGAD